MLTQSQTWQIKFAIHHRSVVGIEVTRPGQTHFIAINYFFFSDGFAAVALCFEVVAFARDFPLESAARAKSVNIHTPSLMIFIVIGDFGCDSSFVALKQILEFLCCAVTVLYNIEFDKSLFFCPLISQITPQ